MSDEIFIVLIVWVLKSLEDKLKVRYLGCFCNVTPSVSPGKRCEERVYSAHASFSITPPPALLSSPSFASLISHSVSPPLFSLEAWDKLEEWWMSCPPSRCWFIQACTLIYKQIQRADVCLCVCPFVWLCVFIVTCTFSFVVRKSVIKVALFFFLSSWFPWPPIRSRKPDDGFRLLTFVATSA